MDVKEGNSEPVRRGDGDEDSASGFVLLFSRREKVRARPCGERSGDAKRVGRSASGICGSE